eukprot:scaffold23640_cov132-Isochrysis_galbana.AAC.7
MSTYVTEHRDDAEGFKSTAEQHRDAAKEYRDGLVKGAKDYMEDAKAYRSISRCWVGGVQQTFSF